MTTNTKPSQFDALRGQLYAPESVWIDGIDTLFEHLKEKHLHVETGRWAIRDAVYTHIGKYAPGGIVTSERYQNHRSTPSDNATFVYSPDADVQSYWLDTIRDVYVEYDSGWALDADIDPDGDCASSPRSNRRNSCNSGREQKYIIGGSLTDPVVTRDPERAAEYIVSELSAVAERIEYNIELTRCYKDVKDRNRERPRYGDYWNPVNIYNIGESRMSSLASSHAVYSNLALKANGMHGYTSKNSSRPDWYQAYENCRLATAEYYEQYHAGDTESSLRPEDVFEYPKDQPVHWY